jgi:hypothetical protein
MVNLKRLTDRAKEMVEKRGGTDALKADAEELGGIAKGKGSLKEKAKAAADAVKDPGKKGGGRSPDAGRGPAGGGERRAGTSGVPHHQKGPEGEGPTRSK